ncbi:MAG: DUF6531 domain-containing protein [Pseudomonadota bacterium]
MHKINNIFSVVLAFFAATSFGVTINRVNGSLNISYVDFSVPGYAVPLELVRSYNSITALSETSGWSGAFGWGWTSPIETTLTVTPEKKVILRDGGTGNNIIFSPSQPNEKAIEAFSSSVKKAYFEQQKRRKLTESELSQLELPSSITTKLKSDSQFRSEMASRFGITTDPGSELLVSSDYGYQTLQFRKNQWFREKDGIAQIFDKDGRLTRQVDKNGFYFDYIYENGNKYQVTEIHDQDKVTSLKLVWKGDRIVSATDNRGRKSSYQYDGLGNLTQVTDSNQQIYSFKYEGKKYPHLLTQIDYVTESKGRNLISRVFQYDESGLVTYHRDKEGLETLFSYGRTSTNPDFNFWTKTIYKSSVSQPQEVYEEFLLKLRSDGTKYLYKQDVKEGTSSSSTLFSSCCGKPLQITKNGEVTTFKYTPDGLLKEKTNPRESIQVEYEPKWNKITKVIQNGVVSNYEYDNRGNLIKASNSRKEKVALTYDKYGRITELTDLAKKKITFKYGPLGKPVLIADNSLGSVKINYDLDGRILKTETEFRGSKNRRPTEEESKEVIRKILGGFQNLLDIIRPAGIGLSVES